VGFPGAAYRYRLIVTPFGPLAIAGWSSSLIERAAVPRRQHAAHDARIDGTSRTSPDEPEYRRMLEDLRRTAGLSRKDGALEAPK
jgi:hypothetical protein